MERTLILASCLLSAVLCLGFVPQEKAVKERGLLKPRPKVEEPSKDRGIVRIGNYSYKVSPSLRQEGREERKKSAQERPAKPTTSTPRFSPRFRLMLGILFLLGVSLLIAMGYLKGLKNLSNGFTIVEFLIAISIFTIVVLMTGSLMRVISPIYRAVEDKLSRLERSKRVNLAIYRYLLDACEDDSHSIEISSDGTLVRFYTCDSVSGDREFSNSPWEIYLSGDRIFVKRPGGNARSLVSGISSLNFYRDDDKIRIRYEVDSSQYVFQVAIRTK